MKRCQAIICTLCFYLVLHVVTAVVFYDPIKGLQSSWSSRNHCSGGADVAFLMFNGDISLFKLSLEKDFIKKTMARLEKMSSQFNAAIVAYNHEAAVKLDFAQTFEMKHFLNLIDSVGSQDLDTNSPARIDRALQITSDHVFGTHGGSRLNTPKIAVLLTKGSSRFDLEQFPLRNASESLKLKNVRLLIVGIGVDADQQELREITDDANHDFIVVKGFSSLPEYEDVLAERICSAIDNPWIECGESRVTAFPGGIHVFTCHFGGIPMPDITFFRNGQKLKVDDFNGTVEISAGGVFGRQEIELLFFNVELGHAGNYTCQAQNKYNTRRRNLTLTVSCPPSFPIVTASDPSEDNKSVNLRCKISSLDYEQRHLYFFKWKFNKNSIQESAKYNMSFNINSPYVCMQSDALMSLRISNFSKQDLGQYKCAVLSLNTTLGEDDINLWDTEAFIMTPPPEIVSAKPGDCGRSIEVKWNSRYDWHELQLDSTSDRKIQAYNTSHLSLSGPHLHVFYGLISNTIYEVRIRARTFNGFGLWAKREIRTTAERPNKFPVKATSLGCSVNVSWETPSKKGCPVTRYTIHYKKSVAGNNERMAWKLKHMKVDRPKADSHFYHLWLECSQTYDFIVLGWNERGHSDLDEGLMVVISTEKGVPFTPLLQDVKDEKCGVFNASWESLTTDSGGGPITAYRAQVQMEHKDWHNCTASSESRSCLFRGLVNKGEYRVRVQAINRKGPSDWFNGSFEADSYTGPPDPPVITNNKTETTGRNVTVMWRRTSDNNCHITMYTLHYRIVGPAIKDENWSSMNITDTTLTRYELQLQYSKEYELIVSAWNKLGHSNSNAWHLKTAQDVPYPPTMLRTDSGQCNSINITWIPPTREALGGPVIDYLAQITRKDSRHPWHNCSYYDTFRSTSCLFTSLKKDTFYKVRVMAKNRDGYGLPAHKIIKTEKTDRPDTPTIINTETKVPRCNVTIKWKRPPSNGCPIRFYSVHYKQKGSRSDDMEWSITNVTDPNVNHQKLVLKCTTTYLFKVKAWNEEGGSDSPSKAWPITTGESEPHAQTDKDASSAGSSAINTTLVAVLLVAFSALVIVLLLIAVRRFRKGVSRKPKRTVDEIQVLDVCEIHPIRTEFVEELGEGAFGKVHKATLKDGFEFFKDKIDVAGKKKQQKTVAVKELHENATEEQRREFLDEIELMKNVGKHHNVLSFLGCWTTTKPLLLIIEYVAHGDLLHWLRRKRSQINSSGGDVEDKDLYAGSRKQITTTLDQAGVEDKKNTDVLPSAQGPDSDECTIPLVVLSASGREEDTPAEKKDDECNEDCESFYPADLMSFAWQIARGMNYLSEKGLVHRDLAARNVLVGHGKLLKIADFGLMREVYHEVYEVQKQKKLPVKWMAPESLYEQIFTSKSDVWSCGVVMWEIATVGGTPYPLLGNAELMRCLKTGYRMEKPDLCSDKFYTMMLDCWKQNSDERPSFQELLERLEQLMLQEVDYFDFNKVDESKDYYQVQESKTEENDDNGNGGHV